MKKCSKCHRFKDECEFHPDRTAYDYLQPVCKECHREMEIQRRIDKPHINRYWRVRTLYDADMTYDQFHSILEGVLQRKNISPLGVIIIPRDPNRPMDSTNINILTKREFATQQI